MIRITRLNGSELVVNADMIEFIQANPDTVISLVSKRKLVVKESIEELIEKVVEYRRKVYCWAANSTEGG